MVTKSKRRKLFPNFIIKKKNSGLIMDQQGTNGTVQRVQEQNRRYVGQSTSAAASSGALAPLAKIEIGTTPGNGNANGSGNGGGSSRGSVSIPWPLDMSASNSPLHTSSVTSLSPPASAVAAIEALDKQDQQNSSNDEPLEKRSRHASRDSATSSTNEEVRVLIGNKTWNDEELERKRVQQAQQIEQTSRVIKMRQQPIMNSSQSTHLMSTTGNNVTTGVVRRLNAVAGGNAVGDQKVFIIDQRQIGQGASGSGQSSGNLLAAVGRNSPLAIGDVPNGRGNANEIGYRGLASSTLGSMSATNLSTLSSSASGFAPIGGAVANQLRSSNSSASISQSHAPMVASRKRGHGGQSSSSQNIHLQQISPSLARNIMDTTVGGPRRITPTTDTSPPNAILNHLRRAQDGGAAYMGSPTKFITPSGESISFSKILQQVEVQHEGRSLSSHRSSITQELSSFLATNGDSLTGSGAASPTIDILAPQPIKAFINRPESTAKLVAPKPINPIAMKNAYDLVQVQQALSGHSSAISSPLATPRVTPLPRHIEEESHALFNAITHGDLVDVSNKFLEYLNDPNSRSPTSNSNSIQGAFSSVLGTSNPNRPDSVASNSSNSMTGVMSLSAPPTSSLTVSQTPTATSPIVDSTTIEVVMRDLPDSTTADSPRGAFARAAAVLNQNVPGGVSSSSPSSSNGSASTKSSKQNPPKRPIDFSQGKL
ncbi:hypothetical protein WR25_16481 isoform C [Diploscapter pachys]|uniref:Uncharacterized protein n=1 Tax=Diploscapter pachys TaxID=2018661 RepID=A0A2A2J988_9BILA|nr:hypothetical protein WR25_16481 isoform A [Diploscapter pachys]PAV58232.1 hypothetical protein WR25_16481 isoform B [Diploscapter pachys]PAV58233.1 hypothetical protein WR25_16481 isoform C [Diploscapter pachys]